MSKPLNRTEFVIRFACGAIFFGLIVALLGVRFVAEVNAHAITAWVVITAGLSILVAIRGDDGWRSLANFFRWW